MTRDHSPSQTYLRPFCSAAKTGYLNIYRKDGPANPFYSHTKNVCWEKNGDRNNNFEDPFILRELLQNIEPRWAGIIEALEKKKIQEGAIGIIDTYLACLRLCSPVAKRVHRSFIEQDLTNILSFSVNLKKIKSDITESFLTEGQITIERDFANARGISALVSLSLSFSKTHHLILYNDTPIPFLTSDNPAIPVSLPGYHYSLTYCPLTPRVSVLLMPTSPPEFLSFTSLQERDFDETTTRYSLLSIKDIRVQEYNREIVKFADDKIISNVQASWVTDLVQQFKDCRTKIVCTKIKSDNKEEIYQYKQQADRA